jgi:hypothetical protein
LRIKGSLILLAGIGTPGPLLPFVSTIDCCGAARQTGYSLRVLNLWMVELTHCGRSGPSQVQVTLIEQSLTHSSSLLMQREKYNKDRL